MVDTKESAFTEQELDKLAFMHMDLPVFGDTLCFVDRKYIVNPELTIANMQPLCPAVHPKIRRVVEAAPFMFHILERTLLQTEQIINSLEVVNDLLKKEFGSNSGLLDYTKQLSNAVLAMQNNALAARRVAVIGAENFSAEIIAERVDKRKQ